MTTATKYKTYSKYKSSGIDWLGDIPEEWKIKRLKYLTECYDTKRIPLNSEERGEKQGDYPYWGANGVLDYVDEYLFDGDYVLLGEDGAPFFEEIKQVSFYTSGRFWVNNHAHILKAIKIHPRLLVRILNVVDYKQFIDGSTRDKLTQSNMGIIPIQLPSNKEQKEIVDFLDSKTVKIDEMVEKKQKMMQLLKEKRQALITHAVTKGLDPKAKMKPSGIDWLGDIPEGWEVKKAKYLGRAIIGLTYSPDEVVNENEGVLILRSSNIQNGLIELNDNVYVKKEIPEDLITKIGDILICSRNGSVQLIGKNILIDESTANLSFGAFMTIFRSKYHEFLYYFFNSSLFTSQTGLFSTSTINQLTTSMLDNMEIPLPSGEVQKEIVIVLKNKTAKIDEMMKKVETQIEKLKEYRQALITSAVTGKIMVN